MAMLLLWS